MLTVPSDTIHGGGFKRGAGGNLRFHLYVAVEGEASGVDRGDGRGDDSVATGRELLIRPTNKYTERRDRRRELCERFVDARGLKCLLGTFFDEGSSDCVSECSEEPQNDASPVRNLDDSAKGAEIHSPKLCPSDGDVGVAKKSASSVELFGLSDEVF
ncbi:hypothetical protein ACHAWF_007332 [Thalassiosira exigua]